MKTIFKVAVLGICFVLMLLTDINLPSQRSLPGLQLVSEAHALLGVRRRTARRTAVILGSATAASTTAQSAAAQQEAATAEAGAAPTESAPATGAALPIGTVVSVLPAGCTPTPVGDVQYYSCNGNFYRAVFQGNQLVYVTAKP